MADTTETTRTTDSEPEGGVSTTRIWTFRILGPVLGALAWLALSSAEAITPEARVVAGIGVLMAVWWMSEALPLSATALLPIVAFPAFGVLSVADATAPYADPIVFLFMGGFLIAIAMQKWNLHRKRPRPSAAGSPRQKPLPHPKQHPPSGAANPKPSPLKLPPRQPKSLPASPAPKRPPRPRSDRGASAQHSQTISKSNKSGNV